VPNASSHLPITVIIPRRPTESAAAALQALRQVDYPQDLLEVIEIEGTNPPQQRNEAALKARGEILYFLNRDSLVSPDLFSQAVQYYDSEVVAGVGGPNLTNLSDSILQKAFGCALASRFAHARMSSRYRPEGKARTASEKELILCNLSVRKSIFLEEGGFNESLYPNEENEFINRLTRKGYRFIYDPDLVVYRSRRRHLKDFIVQLFRYGRGRGQQTLIEGLSLSTFSFLLPLLFLIYLPLVFLMKTPWFLIPLGVYILGALASALSFARAEGRPIFLVLLPFLYILMHLSYGAGILWGLARHYFTKRKGG